MKLQPYEVLSYVIPGFIVYTFLLYLYPGIPEFEALPSIAIAFLIGYYVNMLSSILEVVYFKIWGGKPSNQILKKDMGKIKLYKRGEVIELLKKDIDKDEPSNDELFDVAMGVANNSPNERIKNFNSSYALSRGVLTCVLIVGIVSLIKNYDNYLVWIAVIGFFIASSLRAKQRGYYYAKEVLQAFYHAKK